MSVAVQVTVVSPSANVEPDVGAQVTGREPSTASVAVAVKVTGAPFGPVASATVGDVGTVTVGGSWSAMVYMAVADPVMPPEFVYVQVAVCCPSPSGARVPLTADRVGLTCAVPSCGSVTLQPAAGTEPRS